MDQPGASTGETRTTTATGGQFQPDWYPDPTRRFEFRYHNGQDWTGDVAIDGNRFLDHLPRPDFSTPVAIGGPAAPSRVPTTVPAVSSQGGSPVGSGRATAALVLGIGAVVTAWVPFVFVLGGAAAVVGLALGIPALRRARRNGPVDRRAQRFALAGVILAPIALALCSVGVWLTVLTYREVDRFTNVGDHSIEQTSCVVDDGVATARGSITNLSSDTRSYHVTVNFQRPDTDNTLYTESIDVDGVAAGDSATWSVIAIVDHDELSCDVADVTGPLPFDQS